MKRFLQAVTFTLFLHAFAGWFYIAENAVFHPETLSWGLTHFGPWPREDTFGIVCFGVSLVSLFAYIMIRDRAIDKEKSGVKELEAISNIKKANPSPSKTKANKKKSVPKVMKASASRTSAGSKDLKVSVNKTKANPRLFKTNVNKAKSKRDVRKIKVVDLSEK